MKAISRTYLQARAPKLRRRAAAVISALLALLLGAALFGCAAAPSATGKSIGENGYYASGSGGVAYDVSEEEIAAAPGAPPVPMPEVESASADYRTASNGGGLAPAVTATRTAASFAEKMIYSANASLETVEFEKSLEELALMIDEYGAFTESSNVSGADYATSFYGRNPYRSADYTIRVPRENFNKLLDALTRLGNMTYRSMFAENVTEQYTDTESRLKTYRVQEERLLAMLEKADTVADMITIETSLSNVRYEIESLTSRLMNLDNRVNYSSVYINIREVEKLTEAEPTHQTYGQKIFEGLKNTLRGIGEFFKDALRVFIVNLPILAILAVAAVVVIAIARRAAKKRKNLKGGSGGSEAESDK
ncbi:MAG: DUF4349 domain-containing protein [Oscillospiraceae bacterium]|jgi:hypothetical protein|nr:DUF4349 domain-containing protein [Oscillospiraceae bacterium]